MVTSSDRHSTPIHREVYFPTYIYYRDLPENEKHAINSSIEQFIRAWRGEDPDGIVRSNVQQTGVWHSRVDMTAHVECRLLVEWILSTVQEVFKDLGYRSDWTPTMINMWAVVAPRYGFNRSHIHPGSLWSGVYYVKAPDGAGRIIFTEPRTEVRLTQLEFERPGRERPESWEQVYFDPIEGRTILFPSWLVHEVEPNMCTLEGNAGDRISVSFNIGRRQSAGE